MTEAGRDPVCLEAALSRALARARSTGVDQFVSLSHNLGWGEVESVLAAESRDAFAFQHRAHALVGIGAVAEIEAHGPERFAACTRDTNRLFDRVHRAGEGDFGPRIVGGFAFGDSPSTDQAWTGFPPARFVLPETLYVREGERSSVVVSRRISPATDRAEAIRALRAAPEPGFAESVARAGESCSGSEIRIRSSRPPADYLERVRAALEEIRGGDLEKVVVARRVDLEAAGIDSLRLLRALRHAHPSCSAYFIRSRETVFLGSSPERLVRLEGRRVLSAAIAGSAPRGRSPEEEARRRMELVESKKEQAEHAIVVRHVQAALEPLCERLEIPEAPRLRSLEGITHLETPIRGALRKDASVIGLVAALHPTPAVGGSPRAGAVSWLAACEGLDRGWYAGPVGFVDSQGGGEFCVALRCALLTKGRAHLFAGAGVVTDSVPERELAETRLKLNTVLLPLLEI